MPITNSTILFNRYEILSHVGEGGMGDVYKVLDKETNNIVALKTLIPKAGKNLNSIIRFKKEFSSLKKLNHENIIKAFDFHQDGDNLFAFTMELVEGRDLDSTIYGNNSLDLETKISILEKIADGLTHAHSNNFIHRDLKPANILISNSKELELKIVDFGLAQQESDGADMSQSSNQIGTAYYMSPEQHRGEELDFKTDIYSFGILAFELFTKQRPFDGSTTFKLFLAHVSENIPEVKKINSEVPSWISMMIEICAEKEKKHRYKSMSEVLSLIRLKRNKKKSAAFVSFKKIFKTTLKLT